jgi:uncharacterized membrane protein YhaH (DUF805 family)
VVSVESSLWSSKGRIARKTFWLRWLAGIGVNMAGGFVAGLLVAASGERSFQLISVLVQIVTSVFLIIQSIKRLHDVGKSGWYSLIPFYNIVLYATAGVQGPNEYGEDPQGVNVAGLQSTFE